MAIPIEQEDEKVTSVFRSYLECCIFCGNETTYWHLETNRPCCPQCSVTHEPGDIDNAEFNY